MRVDVMMPSHWTRTGNSKVISQADQKLLSQRGNQDRDRTKSQVVRDPFSNFTGWRHEHIGDDYKLITCCSREKSVFSPQTKFQIVAQQYIETRHQRKGYHHTSVLAFDLCLSLSLSISLNKTSFKMAAEFITTHLAVTDVATLAGRCKDRLTPSQTVHENVISI